MNIQKSVQLLFVSDINRNFAALSVYDTPGRYQSGQMGQTVNLLAKPSEVRILPSPQKKPLQVVFFILTEIDF